MEAYRAKFKEEAAELISNLEGLVLKLEKNRTDKTNIEDIFRVMHSLKGGSAMFGFVLIDKLTHLLENIYDNIRNGKMSVTDQVLDITLDVVDHLRNLLGENESNFKALEKMNNAFIVRLNKVLEEPQPKTAPKTTKNGTSVTSAPKTNGTAEISKISELAETPENEDTTDIEVPIDEDKKTYLITFSPSLDFFKDGSNPLFLIEDLKALGETIVVSDFSNLPEFDEIDPTNCYIGWKIALATSMNLNEIMDVFIFINQSSKIDVQLVSDSNLLAIEEYREFFRENLSENSSEILNKLHKLTVKEDDSATQSISTTSYQTATTTGREQVISSIRVSNEKLDNLINWVSELVTIQAQLSIYAQNNNCPGLTPITEEIEKITRRLRDDVFSIRLIPVANMMTRFERLVRELSHELGKEVEFESIGTDTELDKNIIEMLLDPVMHIIRNCMDHGIEDNVKDRIKLGKPAKGKIVFEAFYSGTNVFIQIKDDGKGIDKDRIRKKAIEKGLIAPEQEMSRKELFDMLFNAGFSTATKVTNLSGRGVGLDVVKRKISDLRGSVEIDSSIGKGTTITMKLPLTLSIIDGLLVKIDDIFMVMPLSFVHKVYEYKSEILEKAVNNMVLADNEPTPVLNLRKIFNIDTPNPAVKRVITIDYGDYFIGLTVDEIVGEYQAVLKPLGNAAKAKDFFSGATILGDGTVALVLDPNKLIEQYAKTEIKKGVY